VASFQHYIIYEISFIHSYSFNVQVDITQRKCLHNKSAETSALHSAIVDA